MNRSRLFLCGLVLILVSTCLYSDGVTASPKYDTATTGGPVTITTRNSYSSVLGPRSTTVTGDRGLEPLIERQQVHATRTGTGGQESVVVTEQQYNGQQPSPPRELPFAGRDFGFLILAGVFLVLSVFLLNQSVSFLAWATPQGEKSASSKDTPSKESGVPAADAGLILSITVSAVIIALWLVYWANWNKVWLAHGALGDGMWMAFVNYPGEFVPAFLLAALFPSAVAAYKFFLASALAKSTMRKTAQSPFAMAMIVGVVCSGINFAGSIASILGYFSLYVHK